MNERRLESLLARFPDTHVLVLGDFFLDLYLDLDRTLSESSLETGLEAYQVVGVRASPGAAGTVTSNLRALGVGVSALGVIGEDGRGYELLRGLRQRGVDETPLIQVADRFTPTYTKPMMREPDGQAHELNRLDIKNRAPLSAELEARLIAALRALMADADGIVVADQVQERNCGVVTDRVRAALAEAALLYPDKPIVVDSRVRIGEFRGVSVKPNAREAAAALGLEEAGGAPAPATVQEAGRALAQRTGRPAFVTVGAEGVWVFEPPLSPPRIMHGGEEENHPRTAPTAHTRTGGEEENHPRTAPTAHSRTGGEEENHLRTAPSAHSRTGEKGVHVPGIRVPEPIDVVGAGDSVMAGIVSALCCGATPVEAAEIGNLVASITVQQIGTTGTATREQVLARNREL